jgi:hypothetical protein
MAIFVSQSDMATRRGAHAVVATVVKLEGSGSESFDLPNMTAASNAVVQLRRPGDTAVTVSQSDTNTVAISGGSAGQEVLLISSHNDPVVSGGVRGTAF